MASIEKRTTDANETSYRVKVRLKGYPTQTATFQRLTDAKKWAAATESAIREGRHFKTAEVKKHTFADLVDRYIKDVLPSKPKKARDKTQQLTWWKAKLGYCLLSDISAALIVQCRDELSNGLTPRGTQRTPATVVQYMTALSHAFTIAVNEWQWLEDSPMRTVKKPTLPRGRVRFLDDDEHVRLLAACQESTNKQLYLCVMLALSTGMRQAELMGLKWPDVNLNHPARNQKRRTAACPLG